MVYMGGDNNLASAGERDLDEMRTVGSTPDVQVVVQFDRAGAEGTRRIHVQRSGTAESVDKLGQTDSGDPQVLLEAIRWCATEFPAERYALILWNHGGGWEPAEIDRIAKSVDSPAYVSREATERSASRLKRAFFRTTLEKILIAEDSHQRAILSDDGSGHSLDTIELGKVLEEGVKVIGQPFDLLGMDACLMSNVEVAYQVRKHARMLVASEESEPADGWPYDRILPALAARPMMSPDDLAGVVVNEYVQSYADSSFQGNITQAAVNPARLDRLGKAIDALAASLMAGLPSAADAIWRAQRKSTRFWNGTLWDIAGFCSQLAATTADPELRVAAQAVEDALRPAMMGPIVAEGHSGKGVKGCGGLSIYLTSPLTGISPYYQDLEWAKDHPGWLAMLRAYHDAP